jgi:hypothetical protein
MQWLESLLQLKGFGFEFSWIFFLIHKQNGWKQIPKVKKGLSCSLGNNYIPKGSKI